MTYQLLQRSCADYNKMCVADNGAGFDMHMLVTRSACIRTYTSIQ